MGRSYGLSEEAFPSPLGLLLTSASWAAASPATLPPRRYLHGRRDKWPTFKGQTHPPQVNITSGSVESTACPPLATSQNKYLSCGRHCSGTRAQEGELNRWARSSGRPSQAP